MMAPEVDGVLLAAGFSRRAGTFKMEAALAGKPLLAWSLEAMARVCRRVIVVAGFQAERVERLVRGRPGTELVVNGNFASGMLSSVQAGAARVRAPRFFLHPGDMPLVRAAVYRKLLERGADIVVPAHGGRRGHPVLLSSSLIPAILAEAEGSSLGSFIHRRGFATVEVDDAGILADLDEMEDMKRMDAILRAGSDDD
jgi:molybdenum cofactor cytidylyltransferase